MDVNELLQNVETFWLSCLTDDEAIINEVSAEIYYLYQQVKEMVNTQQDIKQGLYLCEAVLEAVWESLNIGHWSSVPLGPRLMYSKTSLLKCLLLLRLAKSSKQDLELQPVLSACDMGLLLGAPLPNNILQQMAQMLNTAKQKQGSSCDQDLTEVPLPDEILSDSHLPPAQPIPQLSCPSLQTFYTQFFCPHMPLVLTECIEHWPARNKWSPNYLKQVAGGRTVPIELGVHYADEDWSQRLMTLDKFVDEHLLKQSQTDEEEKPLGYLAQHLLFDQVPELKDDIYEPDYCCLHEPKSSENPEESDNEDEDGAEINAWFGPANTLSPLHFDPKHNILVQVKGYKRVWLFSPDDSTHLYPHESATLLSNTARVNPEKPDLEQFPSYKNATALRCLLRPGDALYIPPRWWHHVRALTPSMSVSFWWQ